MQSQIDDALNTIQNLNKVDSNVISSKNNYRVQDKLPLINSTYIYIVSILF